ADSLNERAGEMRSLGARLFRFEVPWRALAPTRPGGDRYDRQAARDPAWTGYRWERLDTIIGALTPAGIQPVPMLVYAPSWSTGLAAETGGAAAPPGDAAHSADVMTALARRYRSRVTAWELWNEPDHPHGWSDTLARYVERVLIPGATALREAAPECRVVLGGLASHTNLPGLYATGAGPYFDIASVHYYPTRPLIRRVRGVARETRQTLDAHGDVAKPLWLTEVSVATRPPSTPSGFGGHTSERRQARFVRNLYRRVPADAICYYQLRDSAIFDADGRTLKRVYWGLSERDGARRKPAYEAFRAADV
ncbi:MAG: hypothetical protein ACRDHE_05905, partial [Ktedonobacterales bacterium]